MTARDATPDEARMTLREHLDELRGCLLRSFVAFLLLFMAGLGFTDWIQAVVKIPWEAARANILAEGGADPGTLKLIGPAEGFLVTIKASFLMAVLVGGPYFLWELWRFIASGLHAHERRAVMRTFPYGLLMFVAGLAFGFRVLLPIGLRYLVTFGAEHFEANISVSQYFGFLVTLTFLMGAVFQLPLLMWVLARTGLVPARTLGASRKVAILVILVFGAIMTPPDVVTQVLVAGPVVVLYELGLWLARRAERAREREVGA